MAANLTVHTPIIPIETVSGNTPNTQSILEKAAQTFLAGVPVQLNAGFLQRWDGTTFNKGIAGISNEMAHNLATNGAGAPVQFGQIGPPGAIQTWGSVPNEPNGVNIAIGTPISDGRVLTLLANSDTIFEATFDNSAGAVPADYTPVAADIGNFYGMTFDANGYAYVDGGKVTVGTNTCVQLVGINPVDGFTINARVHFIVAVAARQLNG